jgi:hypothetical protein
MPILLPDFRALLFALCSSFASCSALLLGGFQTRPYMILLLFALPFAGRPALRQAQCPEPSRGTGHPYIEWAGTGALPLQLPAPYSLLPALSYLPSAIRYLLSALSPLLFIAAAQRNLCALFQQ